MSPAITQARPWRGVIEEYRDRLPITEATPVITLREGGTPLVHSESLSEETGLDVWLKYEGGNPTGSFKDRGMTVAISKAIEEGSKAVVCASTGNTSASAAAYAAKAGLTCAVLVPVGNAGNISAHWMGYTEYVADRLIERSPHMLGFQASGAAPIVLGHPVDRPSTIATAIRIGNPASWDKAVAAAKDSAGEIRAVTDREIMSAYRRLALEGLFCEMASAASVAGLLDAVQDGRIPAGATAVCVLTGHGLKDPDWAIQAAGKPPVVPADAVAVAELLGL